MKWRKQECGCVKATLVQSGRVVVRCDRHRGKPSKKRLLCYWDEGIIRAE